MKKVYIFGHKNPDTDSVCSAIAYANLKNIICNKYEYVPVILGEPNKETQYVLDKAGIEKPQCISGLKPEVSDLHLEQVSYVKETDSIKDVIDKIVNNIGRSVPVVGRSDNFIGVISISDLMPLLMKPKGRSFLKENGTPYRNLVTGLSLLRIQGGELKGRIKGESIIITGYPDCVIESTAEDILICPMPIFRSISKYIRRFSCLILTDVISDDIDLPDHLSGSVYITHKTLFELTQSLQHTAQIKNMVTKSNLEYFTTYETLEDVKRNMMTSKFRRFPVVDEMGRIKGMISKSNLLEFSRKKAILIDHNEKKQTIDEVDDVTLLEVIDHHRVADINTVQPLYFRVEPVGSTATIVKKLYDENDVDIDEITAKLLLSAIYSDTLLFNSPTTTQVDRNAARELELIAGYELTDYGIAMIRAGSELEGIGAKEVLTSDMKRFMFGEYSVVISQRNTSDFDGFHRIFQEVFSMMGDYCHTEKVDLFVTMVTDIISGGTEIIAVGAAKWIADNAFGLEKDEYTIFREGIFSRKKQVVPVLMKAAKL